MRHSKSHFIRRSIGTQQERTIKNAHGQLRQNSIAHAVLISDPGGIENGFTKLHSADVYA